MESIEQYEAPMISIISENEYRKAVAGSYKRYGYGGPAQTNKPAMVVMNEIEARDLIGSGYTNTLALGSEFDGYYPELFTSDRVAYGFSTVGAGVSRHKNDTAAFARTFRFQSIYATVGSDLKMFFWACGHGCHPVDEGTDAPPIQPDSTLLSILSKLVKLINKPAGYILQASNLISKLLVWVTEDLFSYKKIKKSWHWESMQSDVMQNLYIYLDHYPSQEASFDLEYLAFSTERNILSCSLRWHLNSFSIISPDIANVSPDQLMWVEALPEKRYSLLPEEITEQSVGEVLENHIEKSEMVIEAYSNLGSLDSSDKSILRRNKKKLRSFKDIRTRITGRKKATVNIESIYLEIQSIAALETEAEEEFGERL